MALVKINTYKSFGKAGDLEMHYGYICEVGPAGELTADIPDEMLPNELAAGRMTVIEASKKKKAE